ncbi:PAS domain-containing protein [Sphingobium sp.]|uniref:PAS domain-containing protein n=1 Tax=Sphingobium sp. TaxID=1912891 RepID=UPI003BB726B1
MLDELRGQSVAAAELVRNFAHWREIGAREPVMITHHGRETHIFMGVDNFRTMAAREIAAPPTDLLRELASHIHQGLILCNADLMIDYANGVALAMTRRWDQHLDGKSLWDALPEFAGTLTEAHIRHSLTSGEASAADIPSPFRSNSWLHFETFPFGEGIGLLLRDITADMQRYRLADVKIAILKAMSVHGRVGYVRVSTRGFIETADETFCAMVGLPENRLSSVCISDLVELSARPAFREQLEQTLRGEGDRRVTTRLLTNDGALLGIDAAIAQLHGTYGNEGAVIVVTLAPD